MIGCQKEGTGTSESNLIEVGFNSNVPSITFDDESLVGTRAYSDESKYLIQVRSDEGLYAYGVLKDITNQKILMEVGKTYTMEVAYYPNGHDMQFYYKINNTFTDGFVYSITDEVYPDNSFGSITGTYHFSPNVKYYAKNITYTASSDNTNVNLDLEALIFGLSFNVENLTEGYVKVADSASLDLSIEKRLTSSITITPDKPNYESIYSMQADSNKGPSVLISYVNKAGVESKIYDGELPIARLKKTIVNINLKPVSNESESSFSVDLEQYSITDGETLNLTQE